MTDLPSNGPDPSTEIPENLLIHRDPQAVWADAGRLFAVFAADSRYAHLPLSALWLRILPALSIGQYALAQSPMNIEGTGKTLDAPRAAVIYARVSPEIDARLRAATELPRLSFGEWESGPHPWIIDTPGDQKAVGRLLDEISRERLDGGGFSAFMLGAKGRVTVRDFGL